EPHPSLRSWNRKRSAPLAPVGAVSGAVETDPRWWEDGFVPPRSSPLLTGPPRFPRFHKAFLMFILIPPHQTVLLRREEGPLCLTVLASGHPDSPRAYSSQG
ncbi:hypothetical protein H1C71_004044, partial [Ictidomys tridecemlineatus]